MSDAPKVEIPIDFLYDSICEKFKLGGSADDIKAYLRKSGIGEETVVVLLNRYHSELDANEQDDVLSEQTQQDNWYGGPRSDPQSHWNRIRSVLVSKKNWSTEMVDSLDSASTSVVGKLSNPGLSEQDGNFHVKGLVLGYVQSGKTANYSAVIAKAIDAGYKFIVVLAGVHNNLRYQTEVRLKEEIVDPNETSCITLTRTDKKGDFSKKESTSANKACGQQHGFSMAVIKKNASVLRSFNSWLGSAKAEYLEKCPVLIIDDESDQASINTSKDPELNPSAINGAIRKIMSHFKVASYVGYTATPFANMLVDASLDDDLYPRDFFISLRKPPSYTGAEELFGSTDLDDRTIRPGLPIVRDIDFVEANHVRQISKPKSRDRYEMGEGLKIAIDGFLLACAARIARKQWTSHFSMLVHCTHKVCVQQEIHDQIQAYLDEIRFLILKDDPGFKSKMEDLWMTDFARTTQQIDPDIEIHSFDAIWQNCQNVIDHLQMVLENSASEDRLSYEEKFWGIVVGGNTLSRGLTLEGLMTSYFVRTSNYYDSLMQMGRWFGYRRGYLDLIRVFMTDDLKERFFHLANVENEIRDEIHTMAENGDRPIDVGVRIRSLPGMAVTNAMKMRSADTSRMSLSCTKVQPTYHNLSIEGLRNNQEAVRNLFSSVQSYGGKKVASKFSRFQESQLFRGVSSEVVLQFLDDFEFSVANIRFSADKISDYITQIRETGELGDWSVAFVSKIKATESVTLSGNVKIGLSDRSIADGLLSELDRDAKYISRVATPIDEFIDMGDLVQDCPSDVDAFTKIEGTKKGVGYLRRRYRPKNRGLLLIYAINPNSQLEERVTSSSPYPLVPIRAPDTVFSACFVFPETASDRGTVNYVVNRSISLVPSKRSSAFPRPTPKTPERTVETSQKEGDEPAAKLIQLSKSRFQAGLQCPKRLFLECYHYDERDEVSSAQEAIFDMGQNVGQLAQKRFSGGRLVDFDCFHQKEAHDETNRLLQDDSIVSIYEAAFTHDNIKVRVDILNKVGPNEVDLIEVKSSTRVKDEHHTDLAVQTYVVEGSGLKVRRCYLMHIDSSYVYEGGDYDLGKLFALDEITNEVLDMQEAIEAQVQSMWAMLQKKELPEIETGPQCNKPYQCSFHSYCRRDWPEDHISTLPRVSTKLVNELVAKKIIRISDIPDSFKGLTLVQQRVREAVVHNRPYCEGKMVETLRRLGEPLFFIDFETINPALPLFKGSRPFQQLPFQWSAHVQRNKQLEHHEFLADGKDDPRIAFTDSLLKIIGNEGPILVYSAFERTCLNAIARDFPEYSEKIENICSRMVDLLALIRQHFYHPAFKGSFSIKKVLPALVPDLSYMGLPIGDGATAAMSFAKIVSGQAPNEDVATIRRNLMEYCKLDTFAMVKVFEKLISGEISKIAV